MDGYGHHEEQYLLHEHHQEQYSLHEQHPRQHAKSRFQFLIFLIPFLVIPGLTGLTLSLQALLYPIVAESKGASATQYGPVVGTIYLSLFIFGKLRTSQNLWMRIN